jgi:hypothetical protein
MMSEDVRLLTKEKNAVWGLVREFGLDPSGFVWKTELFNDGTHEGGVIDCTISVLSHVSSGFFYKFGLYNDEYSPGYRDRVETVDVIDGGPFAHSSNSKGAKRGRYLQTWLSVLKEEVEAPDLWRQLSNEVLSRTLASVEEAASELAQIGKATTEGELREAMSDLARTPEPDLTGAVQHALAALECIAREHCGDTATMGKLIERYPGLFPKPLDASVEKVWGFASEMGRHIREGRLPKREEVELLVGLSAVWCAYIARKLKSTTP